MPAVLTQPKVRQYIHRLSDYNRFGEGKAYDEKSNKLLDELFLLLEQVSPVAENGARKLWLRAPRGPITDFGDPLDAVESGDFESEEQFVQEWKCWHPNEIEWYELSAVDVKDEGYRAVMLRHRFVIAQDKRREPDNYPYDIQDFVQWLVDGVKECIEMLCVGTYNDFVRENLPPQYRVGKIQRKDFWAVWPENRAEFFKDLKPEEVEEFIRLASAQPEKYNAITGRLPEMTANEFYRLCALGYAANNYNGCELTPKEQYHIHADGRDEELKQIPGDDPDAFHEWLHDRSRGGGHPWEIVRGGNSTHIDLIVMEDEKGYWLYLAGANRAEETVKFFLALHGAGIPVYLNEAQMLARRLAETEMIGIVPEGVIPKYCSSWFKDEHIIAYMNLPDEDREQFLPFCVWYDEPQISLIQEG